MPHSTEPIKKDGMWISFYMDGTWSFWQGCRRNLDARQMSLLRGRRYNRTKKAPDEAGALKGKGVDKMSTASELAAEHGVNEKTIRRDAPANCLKMF